MPSDTASVNTLAMLQLPSLDALTEQQVRGSTCVWDGIPLTTATAVNLGARTARRAGGEVKWYPRACRACVGREALRALYEHAEACPDCRKVTAAEDCGTGRALSRLSIRQGR